ncbi:hypothetical protein PG994_009631 [Apiospora phragmitis]|uniref:Uncharacterized protein n=1 Tax=Apiospora phragmitis TaxID=2905665 RepID=A0ABR1U6Q2_9PEZI
MSPLSNLRSPFGRKGNESSLPYYNMPFSTITEAAETRTTRPSPSSPERIMRKCPSTPARTREREVGHGEPTRRDRGGPPSVVGVEGGAENRHLPSTPSLLRARPILLLPGGSGHQEHVSDISDQAPNESPRGFLLLNLVVGFPRAELFPRRHVALFLARAYHSSTPIWAGSHSSLV